MHFVGIAHLAERVPLVPSAPDLRGWFDYLNRGDRHHELCAPLCNIAHLLDNLILQVPWKDQNEIWTGSADFFNRPDWYVHTGCIAPVLMRIAVYSEIEKVGSDAAVVE